MYKKVFYLHSWNFQKGKKIQKIKAWTLLIWFCKGHHKTLACRRAWLVVWFIWAMSHSSVMAQLYHTVQSWLNYTTQYSHGSTIPHSTVMVYCYLYKCYLQLVVESPSQQVYNMGTLWCLNISVYSAHSVMQLSSCYVLLWCVCTGFAFVYNTTAG